MANFVLEGRADADVPIPNLATVDIPVTLTGVPPGVALDIIRVVELTIYHTWDADLDTSLIDPDGNIVDLSSDNGRLW